MQLNFKLAYNNAIVQHIRQYAMGLPLEEKNRKDSMIAECDSKFLSSEKQRLNNPDNQQAVVSPKTTQNPAKLWHLSLTVKVIK